MKIRFISVAIVVILIVCVGCAEQNETFSVRYHQLNDNADVIQMLGGYSGHYKFSSLDANYITFIIEHRQEGKLLETIDHRKYSIKNKEELNAYYEYENGLLNVIYNDSKIFTYTLEEFDSADLNHYALNADNQKYDSEFDMVIIYEEDHIVDESSIQRIIETASNVVVIKCKLQHKLQQ